MQRIPPSIYDFVSLLMLQNVREQLEESLPGTGGGKNPNDNLLVKILFLLPLSSLMFCYYRSLLQVSKFCTLKLYLRYIAYLELKAFGLVQISSLGNHIRQLYNKIRFRGALAYSAVTANSNQQVNFLPNLPGILCSNQCGAKCVPWLVLFLLLILYHLIVFLMPRL